MYDAAEVAKNYERDNKLFEALAHLVPHCDIGAATPIINLMTACGVPIDKVRTLVHRHVIANGPAANSPAAFKTRLVVERMWSAFE